MLSTLSKRDDLPKRCDTAREGNSERKLAWIGSPVDFQREFRKQNVLLTSSLALDFLSVPAPANRRFSIDDEYDRLKHPCARKNAEYAIRAF